MRGVLRDALRASAADRGGSGLSLPGSSFYLILRRCTMRSLVSGVALVLTALSRLPCRAQDLPAPDARPVAVLITYDPWAMVIGSDSPSIVVYDDGTIIFRRQVSSGRYEYAVVHDRRALNRLVGTPEQRTTFATAKDDYVLKHATDQPTTRLCLWLDTGRKCTSIYGLSEAEARQAESVPPQVAGILRPLAGFSDRRARAWWPGQIEVMVWPYDHSPEEPAKWPEEWPDLDDPSTVARGEASFSVFVPSGERERLLSFVQRLRERQAVEIRGRKWSVGLRIPFPHDAEWM